MMVDWQKTIFELSDSKVLLYLLENRTARYSELLAKVIGSSSTLANSLKQLQSSGLVERRIKDTRPLQTEYRLSEKGKRFCELLLEIRKMVRP